MIHEEENVREAVNEAMQAVLKPRLTPEFLATLVEGAKILGHSVDFKEAVDFIESLHGIAGVRCPRIVPYE